MPANRSNPGPCRQPGASRFALSLDALPVAALAVAAVVAVAVAAMPGGAAAEPPPALLIISGGGTPESNAINHLDNVRWVGGLWQGHGPVWSLVADGTDPAPDAATAIPPREDPVGWWLHYLVMGGAPLRFQDSEAPSIAGPATVSGLASWAAATGQTLPPGTDLTVYVTDHGTRQDGTSRIMLWGEEIAPDRLAAILGTLPASVTVRFVMAQCYAGGFQDAVGALLEAGRQACGFFAVPAERIAAGCRYDPAAAGYREYTTAYFGRLFGAARTTAQTVGAPAETHLQAHLGAVRDLATIDVPVMSREAFAPTTDSRDHGLDPMTALALKRWRARPVDPAGDPSAFQRRYEEIDERMVALEDELAAELAVAFPWVYHPFARGHRAQLRRQREALSAWLAGHPMVAAWRGLAAERAEANRRALDAEVAVAARHRRDRIGELLAGSVSRTAVGADAYGRMLACEGAAGPAAN